MQNHLNTQPVRYLTQIMNWWGIRLTSLWRADLKRGRTGIRCRLIAAIASICTISPVHASDTIEEIGDVLQYAIPIFGFGATYLNDDRQGRRQLLRSALTTGLTVHGLKFSVDKWRPNFSNAQSFPSGHTASAFVGASFLQTRYGARFGIPAYAAAAYVGYSRIRAQKHYADDVLAGASIAMLSNWLYTEPLPEGVTLTPMMNGDGFAMQLGFTLGQPHSAVAPVAPFKPKSRFAVSFGALNVDGNDVRAPSSGSAIDLKNFGQSASQIPSARLDVEYFFQDRHELVLEIDPLEVRDQTIFATPVSFDSVVYPSGVNTQMEFVFSEIRGVYRYTLVDEDRFNLKVGGGLALQYSSVRLISGALDNDVEDARLLPYLSSQVNFQVSPSISIQLQLEGTELSAASMFNAQASLRYQLSPYWDVGFGVRRYDRELKTSQLFNDFRETTYFVSVGRSF